ncbi:MAG: cobalamin biosynthesis protein CbiG [Gammaproteobacteria bacterium]
MDDAKLDMHDNSKLFNDFLVIDWSANSTPKTGKDSIWWCYLKSSSDGVVEEQIKNPATRHKAIEQVTNILKSYSDSRRRILVGFDFAYAYPNGFADHFSNKKTRQWKSVWRYLSEHIRDDAKNHNNRFIVASEINQHYFNNAPPYWGCPSSKVTEYLSMKKPRGDLAEKLPEFRLVEQGNSTHSAWKLFYNGSVGGQVLLGLPYLYKLIIDPCLTNISKVWPFDTGLKDLTEDDLQGCGILHAEIYPSLIPVRPEPSEVKDRAQVRQLAHHFAGLDEKGELSKLFSGRSSLSDEERSVVENEEGWILGVV